MVVKKHVWCHKRPSCCDTPESGAFRNPQPLVFSQKYRRYKWEACCGTNWRCTAVQIGGVLRCFPFSKAWKPARDSVTNGGPYCGTNWRCTASTFHSDKLYGLGDPKRCPQKRMVCKVNRKSSEEARPMQQAQMMQGLAVTEWTKCRLPPLLTPMTEDVLWGGTSEQQALMIQGWQWQSGQSVDFRHCWLRWQRVLPPRTNEWLMVAVTTSPSFSLTN